MQDTLAARDQVLFWLAFGWGASVFFPVGIAYSFALLMLAALCLRPGLAARLARLRSSGIAWPVAAFVGWTLLVLLAHPWLEDSGTRLFHVLRVVLLLAMGLMLAPMEARAAIFGYLVAGVLGALVVAVHHVWGLPAWDIWGSLLKSRNNFSSGNMIMMASAAGLFVYLGLRNDPAWIDRWTSWGAALALTVTVVEHALSRNAQLLLPALVIFAVVVHSRAWRPLALAFGVVAALAVGAWELSPTTQGRFHAVLSEGRRIATEGDYTTGVGERWRMANEAWQGMQEHPVLGTGVGSWLPRWRSVAAQTGKSLAPEARQRHIEINNPHNEYLLAGMEMGVPGMLILVWLLVALLRFGWRARTTEGGTTFILAASVALSAMINAPLRDAALGMTLLWLLGASMATQAGRR